MTARQRVGGAPRRGFALLTVLWVLSGAAVLGMLLLRTVRESIGAARNRVAATRARWEAEGCAERARFAIDEALRARGAFAGRMDPAARAWDALDQVVAEAPAAAGCRLVLVPVGLTLDVNASGGEELRRLLAAAGFAADRADSVADAILDWRDTDDEVRGAGAEAAWYRTRGRAPPRNGPFAAARELALVRGLEQASEIEGVLGVEPGRVLLSRAPAAVLAALPGFGPEAVERVLELRAAGPPTIEQLYAGVSPPAQARLAAEQSRLAGMLAVTPDAWVLTSSALSGPPVIQASVELLLVRAGRRAAVLRRRSRSWS